MSLTHIQEHVELIAKHEAEFLAGRTRAERWSDSVAAFVGSIAFVGLHAVLFGCWILWNTLLPVRHFDGAPFSLLATIVSLEALVLASFILMRQTRLSRRQDERDHLMLQVLLLTEKETTALLDVNRHMARQLGLHTVANKPEVQELSKTVSIEDVAQTIKDTLTEPEISPGVSDEAGDR